jgi:Zn-dependent M28 family amino/carboxypeptidase
VVVFNDGAPGRTGLIRGTLGSPGARIPAVFATYPAGQALLRARGRVNLAVRASSNRRVTRNVIGDSPFGGGRERVVLGGHLDSVPEGPGINDNASGASTVLAIAEREGSRRQPGRRQLRVAFWAAEEEGLVGSRQHVRRLSKADREAILAYVNLDMVGSRRGRRYTYGSDGAVVDRLDNAARGVIRARGGTPQERSLDGGSDHAPFRRAGVPVYGLFSGAGAPADRCYHRRCDRIGQIGRRTLDDLSRAAAAAVGTALDPRKVSR